MCLTSFIASQPDLPSNLKEHLNQILEILNESFICQYGSKLYRYLDQVVESKQTNATIGSYITNSVNDTLNNILRICVERIKKLCSGLELSPDICDAIWTTTRHALENCKTLLTNRHLDHIILCSIYGVCRALQMKPVVSFKTILYQYKHQVRLTSSIKYSIYFYY